MTHPARAGVHTRPKDPLGSVTVVGIGADGYEGLCGSHQQAIDRADVIVGTWRQLGLLPETIRADRRPWREPVAETAPAMLANLVKSRQVVVLGSGDPMLSGIGDLIVRLVGIDHCTVLPWISSPALACARLGWPTEKIPVMSLAVHDVGMVIHWAETGRPFLVLGIDENSPDIVSQALRDHDHGASTVTILSDLGGPDESVEVGTANEPPVAGSTQSVIAVVPAGPRRSHVPGNRGEATTVSVLAAVAGGFLGPCAGDVLWVVGEGAKEIADDFLRAAPDTTAVLFGCSAQESAKLVAAPHASGLLIAEPGPPCASLKLAANNPVSANPDAIFIGGNFFLKKETVQHEAELFTTAYGALAPGGRLLVQYRHSAHTAGKTASELADFFEDVGIFSGDATITTVTVDHTFTTETVTLMQVKKPLGPVIVSKTE